VFDAEPSLAMLGNIIGEHRVLAERDTAVELVDLCGRLPLALRIAAARLASRPKWRLARLVGRLHNRARRLDELSYHGLALRSSIEVSYRALPAPAKRLFRLCALTTTPDFPEWTAAALLGAEPRHANEVLETLVEAQLVDVWSYPDQQPRIRLPDLIRAYATERLAATETEADRTAAVRRLLGAWLVRAEQAHRLEYGGDYTVVHGEAPRWRRAGDLETDDPIGWLDSERRGLVAAVDLAADHGLDETCWDLALTASALFEVRGYFDDWQETATRALAVTTRAGNRRGQAAMHYTIGAMRLFQGRLREAEECFGTALEKFREIGDEHGSALALRDAATVDGLRSREAEMLEKYDAALAKMRVTGDTAGRAHIQRNMAKAHLDAGDTDSAHELLHAALEGCEQVGYLRGEAQVLVRFAEYHLCVNNVEQAHRALNRVLLIVRDAGDRLGEASALYRLGLVRERTGRLDNADATLRHALSLARRYGAGLVEGQALHALGGIDLARGNTAAGATHVTEACRVFDELGSTLWLAKSLILLSDVDNGRGRTTEAREEIEQATALVDGVESAEADRVKVELEALRTSMGCESQP
jgi:tetratricopeptide (TPR) repeat protein